MTDLPFEDEVEALQWLIADLEVAVTSSIRTIALQLEALIARAGRERPAAVPILMADLAALRSMTGLVSTTLM